MIIIPEEYQNLELHKFDKVFINLLKNKLDENNIALLKINPVGEGTLNTFIFPKGVCFLETVGVNEPNMAKILLPILMQKKQKSDEKIYKRLLTHRYFNIKNGSSIFLKFPFTNKYYFPTIKKDTLLPLILEDSDYKFINDFCVFSDCKDLIVSDTVKFVDRLLEYPSYPYYKEWSYFDEDGKNILLHLLAPEFTIPRYNQKKYNYIEECETTAIQSGKVYSIKPGDLTVDVLRLDIEQINIVNNIRRGHQLILACAGSGKSVLLISKCFKVASLHPDKKFLILCKNRNLCNLYDWRINVAGFRNRNVKCCTFDKLCQDLLIEVDEHFQMGDFEGNFIAARDALIKGKIEKRFFGIFIDEVQIFKSEHYEFCYNLLESHAPDNYFFIICGDKSQDIIANIKQGKAPWQGNPSLPKYIGKSIRIEKNYRNSIQINSFMDRFTQNAKVYFKEFGIDMETNEDMFLRGKAFREGPLPEIIITDRFQEAKVVIDKVLHLKDEEHIPLSEIAILFLYRHYKVEKYYIYKWLKDKLHEHYIEHSELISTDSSYGVLYGDRTGLSLTTIQSALGLDFQAVIVCGLKPMGAHLRTKYEETFSNSNDLEECKEDFLKNINTLYTACTRAREYLYIVLSEDEGKSLYSKILLDSI